MVSKLGLLCTLNDLGLGCMVSNLGLRTMVSDFGHVFPHSKTTPGIHPVRSPPRLASHMSWDAFGRALLCCVYAHIHAGEFEHLVYLVLNPKS